MKRLLLILAAAIAGASATAQTVGPEILIPKPVSATIENGRCAADAGVRMVIGGRRFRKDVKGLPDHAAKEAYRLTVSSNQSIAVEALTDEGAFRALTSLEYMKAASGGDSLQACVVFDYPRFRYRGLMFDISRHFRDKGFILKQLDLMSRLKFNVLHLHLTDDAGWRIRIDGYPELTRQAAWRDKATWKAWSEAGHNYSIEGAPDAFGGYLTKEDVREIVDFATQRHITVIPEIELPGHSLEVTKAYPETACLDSTGTHPVFTSDICPGSDDALNMFKAILDEVAELFPSRFIHIGGDEASKSAWGKCPRCAARMKKHGLSDVDELQSWFVRQFDSYLEQKGRRLLGWDEIMQGGLAPGAAVMSWRGTDHGIVAASQGHDVVMSPENWCYVNRNQDNPLAQGEFVGGYLPLSRVYGYNPAEGFGDTSHLLGVQANLWAEYIPSGENFEYKLYPRAFAIAEIAWTPQEKRSFEDFRVRAVSLSDHIRSEGYNPFDLHTESGDRPEKGRKLSHLGVGAKVKYNLPYSDKYPAEGECALVNGVQGGWTYVGDHWQGFQNDIDVTVDLGDIRQIGFVGGHFMANLGAWVGFPLKIQVQASADGVNFAQCIESYCQVRQSDDGAGYLLLGDFTDVQARYIRFRALRNDLPYHDWLFLDEIIIR